jgi:hypothetical protein
MPGVHIETLHKPQEYTEFQLEIACRVAGWLARGRLVLCEPPRRP